LLALLDCGLHVPGWGRRRAGGREGKGARREGRRRRWGGAAAHPFPRDPRPLSRFGPPSPRLQAAARRTSSAAQSGSTKASSRLTPAPALGVPASADQGVPGCPIRRPSTTTVALDPAAISPTAAAAPPGAAAPHGSNTPAGAELLSAHTLTETGEPAEAPTFATTTLAEKRSPSRGDAGMVVTETIW
jgi:hypothetical protein